MEAIKANVTKGIYTHTHKINVTHGSLTMYKHDLDMNVYICISLAYLAFFFSSWLHLSVYTEVAEC